MSDNVGSSTVYKNVNIKALTRDAGPTLYAEENLGQYTGDTNPVTAIKLFASSGNIASGTCSLYGMN